MGLLRSWIIAKRSHHSSIPAEMKTGTFMRLLEEIMERSHVCNLSHKTVAIHVPCSSFSIHSISNGWENLLPVDAF
jgi:hypothetical protein